MKQLAEPWRPHIQAVAAVLNRCQKVQWDRCIDVGGGVLRCYGWVYRPRDRRADFVVIDVQRYSDSPAIDFGYFTSSAEEELNRELSAAIDCDFDDHAPCQRIEEVFGGMVTNAIKLKP